MPTVLVSNDDLTVLGSPETVELLVDIGPQGTRGSKVFVGIGNPNTPGVLVGQTILLNDLYINTAPGTDYGYLYQYISQPGANTWVQILKMNPTIFSYTHQVSAESITSGNFSIPILISNITTLTSLSAENFNIQYNIKHTKPTSSSITSVEIVGTNLAIDIKAIEYDSGWADLSDTVTVSFFISIVL